MNSQVVVIERQDSPIWEQVLVALSEHMPVTSAGSRLEIESRLGSDKNVLGVVIFEDERVRSESFLLRFDDVRIICFSKEHPENRAQNILYVDRTEWPGKLGEILSFLKAKAR